jgi:hypothetical protein
MWTSHPDKSRVFVTGCSCVVIERSRFARYPYVIAREARADPRGHARHQAATVKASHLFPRSDISTMELPFYLVNYSR